MELIKIPNPILKQRSVEVTDFTGIEHIIDEMKVVARENNLIGLSANQIGITQRFFIVGFGKDADVEYVAFVNPVSKVNKDAGQSWGYEGCGSINGYTRNVQRFNEITITARNVHGNEFGMLLTGAIARVFQHELDHLNGLLINGYGKKFRDVKFVK